MTTHNDLSYTFLDKVFKCKPNQEQSVGYNLYSKSNRLPLIISTYSSHGILTDDKIYSYRMGQGYEVFDHDYEEQDTFKVPKSIFQKYLKASSMFFK